MNPSYVSLLRLIAIEYNDLATTSSIATSPPTFDSDTNDDMIDHQCSSDADEIDMELDAIEMEMIALMNISSRKRLRNSNVKHVCKRRKKRGKYNMTRLTFTNPFTGDREPFTYQYSIWWSNYIVNPQTSCKKWNKLFRNRFRMPYDSYLRLVQQCSEDSQYFSQWKQGKHKYNQKMSSPISLLVLTSLCYLGRCWTLDDLQESTAINKETIRST